MSNNWPDKIKELYQMQEASESLKPFVFGTESYGSFSYIPIGSVYKSFNTIELIPGQKQVIAQHRIVYKDSAYTSKIDDKHITICFQVPFDIFLTSNLYTEMYNYYSNKFC